MNSYSLRLICSTTAEKNLKTQLCSTVRPPENRGSFQNRSTYKPEEFENAGFLVDEVLKKTMASRKSRDFPDRDIFIQNDW